VRLIKGRNNMNDNFQVDYEPNERELRINLPEEVWNKIDNIIFTRYFKPIKKIRVFQKERLTEIFKEIENLKAENKQLKEERDGLFEIFTRHVMRKMYPAKCTDEIQVFESREEYDEVIKFIWKLMKGDKDT
jgi:dihydrofolate reductase